MRTTLVKAKFIFLAMSSIELRSTETLFSIYNTVFKIMNINQIKFSKEFDELLISVFRIFNHFMIIIQYKNSPFM